MMTFAERFFIHAQPWNFLTIPAGKPPRDGLIHDFLELVPIHAQEFPRILRAAAGLEQLDGKCLKKEREAGMLGRPGQGDGFYTVLRAFDPRCCAVQMGVELHGVKVPPTARRRPVIDIADLSTFGATTALPVIRHVDIHTFLFNIEFDAADRPR